MPSLWPDLAEGKGLQSPRSLSATASAFVSSPARCASSRDKKLVFAVLRCAAGLRLRDRSPLDLLIAIEAAIGAARKQTGDTSMATIGTFTKSEDGSLSGAIKTLTLNVKAAQFRPSDKENDKAPDYRIFSGTTEFGAAWKKTSRENNDYLSVKLDDLSFPAPIFASLVDADEGYSLIWSRRAA
jgi:uncharacterized protein (DUF736 family)